MKPFGSRFGSGVIVSVQLDTSEPLHTPQHCALFAQAAAAGGAKGLRAEGVMNIQEVRATTSLPLIGCVRSDYGDGWMLVTPDLDAVEQLFRLGVDAMAMDATARPRPGTGRSGLEFLSDVRLRYPEFPIVADVANYDEGMQAADLGAAAISTSLCGRTKETYEHALAASPNLDLVSRLASRLSIPVLAEGFIWTVDDARSAMNAGAYAVVVGGAITRPRVITQIFVNSVENAAV